MSLFQRLVLSRLLFGVLTLLATSALIFIGTEVLPGDVADAILGRSATPEAVKALRLELNLDQPAYIRYFNWITSFIQGDFGKSITSGQEVSQLIGDRLQFTLLLAALAAVVTVPMAILLGLVAALFRDRTIDKVISSSSLVAISMPEFFISYLLIYWFSIKAGWFPAIAKPEASLLDTIYSLALPVLALSGAVTAYMMRMTRATIINELNSAYIEMAILKGRSRWGAIFWHAFPNSVAPVGNVVAINLAYLVVGVVVVEVVFNYPGMGQLMVDSVAHRDVPMVQACGLIFASAFVLLNLIADLAAMFTNPRLRHPK